MSRTIVPENRSTAPDGNCASCGDYTKQIPHLAPTKRCKHSSNVCRSCLQRWIRSELDSNRIPRCPTQDCPQVLNENEQRQWTGAGYPYLKENSRRARNPSINNIISESSLHPDDARRISFHSERASMEDSQGSHSEQNTSITPRNANNPYGQTERERQEHLRRSYAQSEITIDREYKKCPGCGVPIEKIEGCDEVRCRACNVVFCYACRANYAQIRKKGRHYHNKTCTHYRDDRRIRRETSRELRWWQFWKGRWWHRSRWRSVCT